jgi:hypothetical protein
LTARTASSGWRICRRCCALNTRQLCLRYVARRARRPSPRRGRLGGPLRSITWSPRRCR